MGLQWILGSIRCYKGDLVKPATGIFPEDLIKIRENLDFSKIEDLVFWVGCLIMFRTLLQSSKILWSDFCLKKKDVEIHEWGIVFNVLRMKNIQFKERLLRIPVAEVKGHVLC